MTTTDRIIRFSIALLGICASVHAEGLHFPTGTSPAMQPTAAQNIGATGNPLADLEAIALAHALSWIPAPSTGTPSECAFSMPLR